MNSLLLTRPCFDSATYYLFHWNQHLIDLANRKKLKVLDLTGKRLTKKNLTSYIKKMAPDLLILNGHGGPEVITGENYEELIKVGENENLLIGKIVYSLSCSSAKVLGPKSVDAGAVAFIGYKEDFQFWKNDAYANRPLSDPRASLFFIPSNQIGAALIKGHTVEYAKEKAKQTMLKHIQKLVATNSPDKFVIPALIWDVVHLVAHGDQSAKLY